MKMEIVDCVYLSTRYTNTANGISIIPKCDDIWSDTSDILSASRLDRLLRSSIICIYVKRSQIKFPSWDNRNGKCTVLTTLLHYDFKS